jgi:hypothetical protein
MSAVTDHLFELPSVRAFLHGISDDIACGQSAIVMTPNGVNDDEVWQRISIRLSHRGQDYETIQVNETQKPLDLLYDVLLRDKPLSNFPHTLEHLLREGECPGVIRLSQFEKLPEARRWEWMALIRDWADASHRLSDRGINLCALCVIAPPYAFDALPHEDTHLVIRRWWGIPSGLETQLLYRLMLNDTSHKAVWIEYVLPSLAGSDLALLDYLYTGDCIDSLDSLKQGLLDFAKQCGWTQPDLQQRLPSLQYAKGGVLDTIQLTQVHTLWRHGLACWTTESGLELNTSALLLLGDDTSVEHRYWRGQARLLLPLLDDFRRKVSRYLTGRFQASWCTADINRQTGVTFVQTDDPSAVEWGELYSRLTHHPVLRPVQSLLREPVWLAKKLRNDLAHYQSVTFEEFKRLRLQISELESQVFD